MEHALCYACLVETVQHAIRQNPPELPIHCPGRDGPGGKFRCSALMDDTIRQCMSNELLVEYDRAVLRRGTIRDGDHHCFLWTPCCNKPFEISRKDCRLVPRLLPCPFGCRKTICTGCVNSLTIGQIQLANDRQLNETKAAGDLESLEEPDEKHIIIRSSAHTAQSSASSSHSQWTVTDMLQSNDHTAVDFGFQHPSGSTGVRLSERLDRIRNSHRNIRDMDVGLVAWMMNHSGREVVCVEEHDHLSDLCFDEFLHTDASDGNNTATNGYFVSSTSDADLFRVFQRSLDQNTPRCPTCKRVGLKSGSECNEITCSCGVKWCFCCGKRLARTGEEYVRWMDASPNTTAFMLKTQHDSSSFPNSFMSPEYNTVQTFMAVTAQTPNISSYNHQSWIETAPIEHRFDPNDPSKIGGLCPSTLEHLATVAKVPEFVTVRDQYVEEVNAANRQNAESIDRVFGFSSWIPHVSVKPLEERLMPVFLRYRGWLALRSLQSRMDANTFLRGLQQFPDWRYDELVCSKLGIPYMSDPRPAAVASTTTSTITTSTPTAAVNYTPVQLNSTFIDSMTFDWPVLDFSSLYPTSMFGWGLFLDDTVDDVAVPNNVFSMNLWEELATNMNTHWKHWSKEEQWSYRLWDPFVLMVKLERLGQRHQVYDQRPFIPCISFRSHAPIACSRT